MMVCKHLTGDPARTWVQLVCLVCLVLLHSESSSSPKKSRAGCECVFQVACAPFLHRNAMSSARQDLGIGLVFGDQARHQARPPIQPTILLYLELTAHISPTAVDNSCRCGSGSIISKYNNPGRPVDYVCL